MNNKIVALLVIFLLAAGVTANVLKPTTWGSGYKLYNVNGSYWDLMGENGIQNGSITNMTHVNATNASITVILTIPTSRPANPVNGTIAANLTDNSTETYLNGAWHFSNGTAK